MVNDEECAAGAERMGVKECLSSPSRCWTGKLGLAYKKTKIMTRSGDGVGWRLCFHNKAFRNQETKVWFEVEENAILGKRRVYAQHHKDETKGRR